MLKKFKKSFYDAQLLIESSKVIQILIMVILISVLIITGLELFSINPKNFKLIGLSFPLFLIEFFAILYYFKLIRSFRFDMNARRDFIKNLISVQDPEYHIIEWHEKHIIKENGDGEYIRRAKISYQRNNVLWYQIGLYSTNDWGVFDNLNLQVKNIDTNEKMPRVTFPTATNAGKSIIILDPPLSDINPTYNIEIKVDWPQIWKALVDTKKDGGILTFDNTIETVIFEIEPPTGYELFDLKINPKLENCMEMENLSLVGGYKYTIKNPPIGKYSYSFNSKRMS